MTSLYKYQVWGAIKLAIEEGSVSRVESALNEKIWCINDADVEDGETVLIRTAMVADEPSKIEIMKMLIDLGADIEARKQNGSTALSEAVRMANTPAVRLLLEKGANVNALSRDGKPALYFALDPVTYEPGMTSLLLEFGADTAELSRLSGDLALNIAAKEHNRFAVIELMKAGEDPTVESPLDGLTAEQVAQTWDLQVADSLHVAPIIKAMMDTRLASETIDGIMKGAIKP